MMATIYLNIKGKQLTAYYFFYETGVITWKVMFSIYNRVSMGNKFHYHRNGILLTGCLGESIHIMDNLMHINITVESIILF
jgi:hypothetical protein